MKIAICNVQEFDPTIGGIERVSISLAEELKRQGAKVIFIACRRSPYSTGYSLPGPHFFLPDSLDYSEANVQALTEILHSEHPDVVLNQNAHSLPYHRLVAQACQKSCTPLVSALHFSPDIRISGNRNVVNFRIMPFLYNLRAICKGICTYWPLSNLTLRYNKILYNELYRDSQKTILLSDAFIPLFNQISRIGNSTDKLVGISNMLSFPYNANMPKKKKQILFCGRLYFPQKRPDRVLKIWKTLQDMLPEWELVIVGDGPHYKTLVKYASALSLKRVKFEGFKNPIEYYKSAQILTMTSNHEGFGLVLTEAMQHGCVPVAFDSFASISDIITDGYNGRIVKSFDMRAYTHTVYQLATSNSLSSMAFNAIESTRRFLPENIGKQWMELFESISQNGQR